MVLPRSQNGNRLKSEAGESPGFVRFINVSQKFTQPFTIQQDT